MVELNRRSFLQIGTTVGAAALFTEPLFSLEKERLPLGLFISLDDDPESQVAKVHELGLPTCSVYLDDFERESATRLKSALDRYGIEATALTTLGPGEMVWDFLKGPSTIGLVPRNTRQARIDALKTASDFAAKVGIPALQTHCGFIPENPDDPLYEETVKAIHEVAGHCKGNSQWFLCETGQETPITLLRTILDVGLDNVGVGLDTANLILYGKGNPVDAMDVLEKYVRGAHAKDGLFPTDPRYLGQEVPISQGKVDFTRFITRLLQSGYRGALTIEREISGPQYIEDVKKAKLYLENVIDTVINKTDK
jgi:sugar phosphate isomerase/epimerase